MDISLDLNSKKMQEAEPKKAETQAKAEPKLFEQAETAGTIASAETSGGSKLFNATSETAGTIASSSPSSSSSSSGGGSVSALA